MKPMNRETIENAGGEDESSIRVVSSLQFTFEAAMLNSFPVEIDGLVWMI
jgi:hypothetical protein